ncbi:MAG TPA: carboxylesterase family protein [Acidimicrobiales bacterium]
MIVDTPSGRIQGLEKHGVRQFRGIPFARAERFRAPERVAPWADVHDGTTFGPVAPQNPSPTEALYGGRPSAWDEDCLVLNVFTPDGDLDAARPVMVWIHGGGFTGGSGRIPWYDGTRLAAGQDVVVVTINYRLGALGFLHLAHLDPAFAGSGANGIRDQVMALEWVRDNVAALGGDPGNVTVFGESAGGMSIGTLMGTPAAAGLFRGAIAQSGACAHVHDPDVGAWVTDRLLAALDLGPAAVDGLLSAPVDAILAAQLAVDDSAQGAKRSAEGPPVGRLTFQPVVDGTVLPRPPLETVRAGSAAGVHLVTGSTADEWNLFHLRSRVAGSLTPEQARRRLGGVAGDRVDDVLDAYRAARPDADPDGLVCAVMTDEVFRIPAVRLAEAHLPHAPRVSMYRFDHASPTFGACHGIDVPFVFDNLERGGVEVLLGGLDDRTRRLAANTAAAWAGAARTGSPAHGGLAWPAYEAGDRLTLRLDREPGVVADPDADIRRLWEELAPVAGAARP